MAQSPISIAADMAAETPECPVLKAWQDVEVLVERAARCKLALVSGKLGRQHCVDNADLLIPLINEYGTLTYFDSIFVEACGISCYFWP